jgi:hypothetical protein
MSKTRVLRIGLLALLLLLMSLLAGAVWAGSSDGPAVDWEVLSGGGAPAAAGGVTLNGTLGQTAIGLSSAGTRVLGAGFWYAAGKGVYDIYLPVVLRNS